MYACEKDENVRHVFFSTMQEIGLLLSVPPCLQSKRATEDCLGVRGHEDNSCQNTTKDMTQRMWLQECGLSRPLFGKAPSCCSKCLSCCRSGARSGTSLLSDLHQPTTSAEERPAYSTEWRYPSTEPRVQLLLRSQDAASMDSTATISTNQNLLVSSGPRSQKGANGWL